MEWVKKKDFTDYLKEASTSYERPSVDSDYVPGFLFTLDIPKYKARQTYKVKPVSIIERKKTYLSNLSKEAQDAWAWIEEQARIQNVVVMPWDLKTTWRKLALKIHPDHSLDQGAKDLFIKLRQMIAVLTKATADACI